MIPTTAHAAAPGAYTATGKPPPQAGRNPTVILSEFRQLFLWRSLPACPNRSMQRVNAPAHETRNHCRELINLTGRARLHHLNANRSLNGFSVRLAGHARPSP